MTCSATDTTLDGLSWREQGSGPPVVFLHGLGGTKVSWTPQLDALCDRFRCIAWDMPGYGDTAPIEPLTFAAIADRLVDLLDVVGVHRADLVGLSFGGMHALHTALRHPDRVRRLVLADTSPAFGLDGTDADEWRDSRLSALDGGRTPADIADAVIDAITAITLTGPLRRATIAGFDRIPVAGFRAAVDCLPHHDVSRRLGEIGHRSLVIVGELDEETPPSYSQMLTDGLGDASMETIVGVGHLTPAEAPDEFNRLVAGFLSTQDSDMGKR